MATKTDPSKHPGARDKRPPHEEASPPEDQGAEDESPTDASQSKDKHGEEPRRAGRVPK